jgi:hypothetical protein
LTPRISDGCKNYPYTVMPVKGGGLEYPISRCSLVPQFEETALGVRDPNGFVASYHHFSTRVKGGRSRQCSLSHSYCHNNSLWEELFVIQVQCIRRSSARRCKIQFAT